jgi:uncharacterized protein (UPF0332 family)
VTAQDALARHRIERARETLREADLMIEQRHYNAALNRVYYAAFYAARAALALHRVDSSKHSGVIALFQLHVVKTGAISDDVARVLPKAFTKRLQTDYGDFKEATAEEVANLRSSAETFIAECARIVETAKS